jgi:dUTP pyrophosphatase
MDKGDLEDYINKLKNLEKEMSDDNSEDLSFINELDSLLNQLTTDVQSNFEAAGFSTDVRIKKLHPNAVIPSYSKEGDAGMDLTITTIISETTIDITYGFGLAMEIPKGFVGLVFPRSSVRKYDLSLTNCVGVIDSGYRGEIQATFKKTNWLKGTNSETYRVGDRGAQIIILPYPKINFIVSEELSDTERGEGGFGSTGK